MASELDKAIANLHGEAEHRDNCDEPGQAKAGWPEPFEDAARAVAVEVRRMRDLSSDIDRELNKLRWRGESATYFRKHADCQRVRIGRNIEVMESLRVLLLRAADSARHAHGAASARHAHGAESARHAHGAAGVP
jgi:hypothetical protein